jgi:hypothetical protein
MKKGAIQIVMILCCAHFFGQELKFSRNFKTIRKNVPLAIINNSPDYFYVLRYNKVAHDFVIERRRKSNAETVRFTPLKMDSVNARSFDYENLDYLFFADEKRVFLVFEKVTNSRRAVYLRSCDTNGKAGPFVLLTSMERSGAESEFYYSLKRSSGNRFMVVATRVMANHTARTVFLFDPGEPRAIWEKKLPPESQLTGYAQGFETDSAGNLYFITVRARILEYRRQYVNHIQRMIPVYHYDSMHVVFSPRHQQDYKVSRIALTDFEQLNSVNIFAGHDYAVVSAHFSKHDRHNSTRRSYFFAQRFAHGLDSSLFEFFSPLNGNLSGKLDFFDGGDSRDAADKSYLPAWKAAHGRFAYQLSGREEENFYKEMVFFKTDLLSGRVAYQTVLPRKIFYFSGRSRFKKLGMTNSVICGDSVYTFVLEHKGNEKLLPEDFNYPKFKKQEYATYANLVCYYLKADGQLQKRVVFKNIDYDTMPLEYSGNDCDVIFYQGRGTVERFVTLRLSRF